jgi:hypothetical protein
VVQFEVALHFMFYNFCRIHSTLRVTPAMEGRIDRPCLDAHADSELY